MNLVDFTEFNVNDPHANKKIAINIDDMESAIDCESANHDAYTSIVMKSEGLTYSVKESRRKVEEMVNDARSKA
jgi:hypothetical protein